MCFCEVNSKKSKVMQTPSKVGKQMIPKRLFPYTNTKTDAWDIIKKADQDPHDKEKILLLYSRYSIEPGGQGEEYKNGWNREHVFCQSYLHENAGAPGKATDCHNLFAADPSINSTRSNKIYDIGGNRVVDKSPHADYMGGSGQYDLEAFCDYDSFEPPDISKGVCARAMFYMACVYADNGVQLGEESDKAKKKMGKLSTLLQWNTSFPPSTWEITRNNIIENFQGNRNVFIDNHLLAYNIEWNSEITPNNGVSNNNNQHSHISTNVNYFEPFINEIHYDNIGIDTNEGIEICAHVTENMNQLCVLFYNGKNGLIYKTSYLSDFEIGSVYNEIEVKLYFLVCSGIQNGGIYGDGMALIKDNAVLEFISYETSFCAKEGPCENLVSTNINVFQTNKTQEGTSLQKVGIGRHSADFRWVGSRTENFGELNSDQVFTIKKEPENTYQKTQV